jgi:HK97 family phage major capsid protein
MARLEEIDQRLEAIRAELLTLAEGDLDEEQAARFDALETEHGELETERAPLARRAAMVDRVRSTARQAAESSRGVERGSGDVIVRTNLDPFEGLDQVRANNLAVSDLRGRARTAIEQAPGHMTDDQRQRATELIERGDRYGRIARHMLLTGSDAYSRAFERLLGGEQPYQLEDDELDALRFADSQRAAMAEGSGSTGGFMVPFHLDPTIILTNAGSTNPFRQISRVVSITTNTWHGVSSAGVTAEWLAESAEAADASPSFAQPTVPTAKAAAYLQGSFEVTQDTGIAAEVGMLLADARDRLEATAFAVGTGSGQPKGVVTAVSAVGGSVVASTTADTYAVADVYKVAGAVPPRHRPNSSWVMNYNIALLTRQFATSTQTHAFWADLGMNNPSQLLGRPVFESSAMDGTVDATANNYILLIGDFSKYLIVDRIGMTVAFEPLVKGANRRPTGEVGWFAHWRVGADVLDANAFRLLNA